MNIVRAKTISNDTLEQFKTLALKVSAPHEKEIMDSVITSWKNLVSNDTFLSKIIKIKNYESLLGYKSFLKGHNNLKDLIGRVAEKSAELDLARHILDNREGLEKVLELPNITKTPDFAHGNSYFEAKYLDQISPNKLRNKLIESLSQAEEYAKYMGAADIYVEVWVFSYDEKVCDVQAIVEQAVQAEYTKHNFDFSFHCINFYGGASDASSNNAKRGLYARRIN